MTVHSFPLYRQRGVLDEVIEGLKCRQHEEANIFWRTKAKALLKDLMDNGVPQPIAENEVRGLLFAAVDRMQQAKYAG